MAVTQGHGKAGRTSRLLAEIKRKSADNVQLFRTQQIQRADPDRDADLPLCRMLFDALKRKDSVPMAAVRNAIGSSLAEDLDRRLLQAGVYRDIVRRKTQGRLRSYFKLLKVPDALRLGNRRRGISSAARNKTEERAYRLYGLALEHLEELMAEDPELYLALDEYEEGQDPDRVPRRLKHETNYDIKLSMLKNAVDMANVETTQSRL